MFPWIYEFQWTAGHLIFLGAFFSVLAVISTSVVRAVRRSAADLASGRVAAIRWHGDFDDLPAAAKRCRHDLTGELGGRTCPRGFACAECELHPRILERRLARCPDPARAVTVRGIELPLDRFYHRAHTWVRAEMNGSCTIGLDPFASRIIGVPDGLSLPAPGARLFANSPACAILKDGRHYPVLSPVAGTVEASGGGGTEWWIRLRPVVPPDASAHLLRGAEIGPWIIREMERIEMMAAGPGGAVSLADGGELLPELGGHFAENALDDIRAGLLMSG
jgi:hypothetical protein